MPTRNLIFLAVLAAIAGGSVVAFHLIQSRHQRRYDEFSRNYGRMHEQLIDTGRDIRALRGLLGQSDGSLTAVDFARRLERSMPRYELTEAERRRVLEGGYRGEVEVLREITGDKYLRYVPRDRRDAVTARIGGTARGLGLRFELDAATARVTGVAVGSPADEAGLRPGDRVVRIGATPVDRMDAAEARAALRGRAGRDVELTVVPVGAADGEPHRVRLTGRRFQVQTVQGLYRLPDGTWRYALDADRGLYYVRVTELVARTHEQLRRALRTMQDPQGLVLDLRGNPGGQPEPAAELVNLFVSDGLLFRTMSIHDGEASERRFAARGEGTFDSQMPLVVLTDGETASAAEIVAGALRAHRRAALLGERTCGKPWVQSVMPVGDLGLIIHSTGWYFLGRPSDAAPTGRRSERIAPDVPVEIPGGDRDDLRKLRIRLRSIPRPWLDEPAREARALRSAETAVAQLRWLDAPLDAAANLLAGPRRLERILQSQPDWLGAPASDEPDDE
ncbi:MAG: S41 family peptidase [Planctomycetota bacterium]